MLSVVACACSLCLQTDIRRMPRYRAPWQSGATRPRDWRVDYAANVCHQRHGHPRALSLLRASLPFATVRLRQHRTVPVTSARAFKAPARMPTSAALQTACARVGAHPPKTPEKNASWAKSGRILLPFAVGTRTQRKRASCPHQVHRPTDFHLNQKHIFSR